jgi:tetratricopeptide (TPR) repeat protein
LNTLFAGNYNNVEFESTELQKLAEPVELGVLYRGEQIQLLRQKGQYEKAVSLANSLVKVLSKTPLSSESGLERYSRETALFLLSNFLRGVGCYREALPYFQTAEGVLQKGIPSHDTVLSHCLYANNICYAVVGKPYFDAIQFGRATCPDPFSGALLLLSYSHAAWFVQRTEDSIRYAEQAASAFTKIGADRYSIRATSLAQVIRAYERCKKVELPDLSRLDPESAKAVAVMSGYSSETEWLANWLGTIRPSVALGLLQLGRELSPAWQAAIRVKLPRVMNAEGNVEFTWRNALQAGSLVEADMLLRQQMQVPIDVRVPLLAD